MLSLLWPTKIFSFPIIPQWFYRHICSELLLQSRSSTPARLHTSLWPNPSPYYFCPHSSGELICVGLSLSRTASVLHPLMLPPSAVRRSFSHPSLHEAFHLSPLLLSLLWMLEESSLAPQRTLPIPSTTHHCFTSFCSSNFIFNKHVIILQHSFRFAGEL